MRRLAAITVVALLPLASTAEALTIKDIIELSRAGLGDEVLLALIEVDRGVYAIDPGTLKSLKQAGVSERVIVALVRSGRELPPEPPPAPIDEEPEAPEPQVVVIDHHEPEIREVAVPVPVAVPVYVTPRSRSHKPAQRTFVNSFGETIHLRPKQPEPVYWGFGGKRRPDAWGPKETSKPAESKEPDGKKPSSNKPGRR